MMDLSRSLSALKQLACWVCFLPTFFTSCLARTSALNDCVWIETSWARTEQNIYELSTKTQNSVNVPSGLQRARFSVSSAMPWTGPMRLSSWSPVCSGELSLSWNREKNQKWSGIYDRACSNAQNVPYWKEKASCIIHGRLIVHFHHKKSMYLLLVSFIPFKTTKGNTESVQHAIMSTLTKIL